VRERALRWDGCVNVRDLGGHPTEDGNETAYGAVVRADNLTRLSDAGWDALVAYGVNRIVDLRWADERADEPAHRHGVDVVHVALFGDESEPLAAEHDLADESDWAEVRREIYLERLESRPDRFADALEAVADVPDGCVAVHCMGGVDRTGLVSALMLRLSGVTIATIADDYADSEVNWSPHIGDWIGEAGEDERERERRRFLATIPAATMRGVLGALEERYGTVHRYLVEAGASEESLTRLRAKLRP
jgi:protein tyrosine/serine phosphatase